MNCEHCKRQNATCHFATVLEDHQVSKRVCWDCYQALVDLEQNYFRTHCRYCGKPSTVVITDVEEYTKDEPTVFLCDQCATQYRQVFAKRSDGILDEFLMGALFDRVLDARGSTDAHMRTWAVKAATQTR